MKIHGYFICWNEEKLIPYFLKHYETICDEIHVYDNESTDNSINLLNSHDKVKLHTFKTNNTSHEFSEIEVKSTAWMKSKGKTDWIIVGDMDEFIYSENLRIALEQYDKQNVSAIQPCAWQMLSLNYPSCPGQIYEEVRFGSRLAFYDKTQLFNANKTDYIVYSPGCHSALIKTKGMIQSTNKIKLLHFKMMGVKNTYERNKILNERRSNDDINHSFGTHYNKTLEEVQKDMEELWKKSILVV